MPPLGRYDGIALVLGCIALITIIIAGLRYARTALLLTKSRSLKVGSGRGPRWRPDCLLTLLASDFFLFVAFT